MTLPVDLEQGSEAWLLARAGSLGASRLHEAIARTKTGWGASRANVLADLIAERLTGCPADRFVNAAMQRGTDVEPEACAAYEFRNDVEVVKVGLVPHPTIPGSHASPDGRVGEDGLVEFKVPNTATHIDTLLGASIPSKYIVQVQWQMACDRRAWCDWASYDNRLPESMRLFVQRVQRDDAHIAELERHVREFMAELDAKLGQLSARYDAKREAA